MSVVNVLPSVAVLLAAYNGKNWLDEQITSILAQQSVLVYVYISVDFSNDDTYEYCKDLEKTHSNVTVLAYGERFGGAAKNFYRLIRDVDFSSFDFVSLADQDDIWMKNKLSHACKVIEENLLDAYSSDVIAFWENGQEKLVKKSYPQKKFDYYFEAAGPGCSYVLKVDAMSAFKEFLGQNWVKVRLVDLHDWMVYAFCRSRKMNGYIDDLPLMRYRQHASNQVGFNSGLKAYSKRFLMVKDKWYRNEVEKIVFLVHEVSGSSFRLSRRYLILNFWQLRRRSRDAFVLLVMLLVGVF